MDYKLLSQIDAFELWVEDQMLALSETRQDGRTHDSVHLSRGFYARFATDEERANWIRAKLKSDDSCMEQFVAQFIEKSKQFESAYLSGSLP